MSESESELEEMVTVTEDGLVMATEGRLVMVTEGGSEVATEGGSEAATEGGSEMVGGPEAVVADSSERAMWMAQMQQQWIW